MVRANILVDGSWHGKLADFGFSSEIPHVCHGYTMFNAKYEIRSEGYYAPEVTSGRVSDRSDVYSYGIVRSLYLYYVHASLLDYYVGCIYMYTCRSYLKHLLEN